MHHLPLQVCVMLAAALAGGRLFQRLGYPPVLGEILGGILMGPTGLGMLIPSLQAWLFRPDQDGHTGPEALVRIGMLFFMFVAGLEINVLGNRQPASRVLFTSGLGFLFPFALGVSAGLAAPRLWGAEAHQGVRFALFLGTALSISALPVIARILMDLRLTTHRVAGVVMASATITDVLAWSIFSVLLGAGAPGRDAWRVWVPVGALVILGLVLVLLARLVWSPTFKWLRRAVLWPGEFLGVTSVVILGSAALAEAIGIDGVVGAYLAGIVLGQQRPLRTDTRAMETLTHFACSVFAPLYFVSIGLTLNFVAYFDLWVVALVVLLATVGKVSGATLGARLAGMRGWDAWAVGWALNARGAVEIVFASTALRHGLITERLFVALVFMAVTTSMASAQVLRRLRRPAACS